MNVLQTVAIYVGAPFLLYAVIALWSVLPGRGRKRPKYQPGAQWDYDDQWWAGDYPIPAPDPALMVAGTEGGARGTW